jgi:predicted lipid-binding transport protein (Tim44 family)
MKILVILLMLVAIADARPGGGNTSSGGSRTRSSSSSSSSSSRSSSSSSSSSSRPSSSSSSSRPSSSSSSSRPSSSSSSGSYSGSSSGGGGNFGFWILGGLFGGIAIFAAALVISNRRFSRGSSVTVHSAPVVADVEPLRIKDPAFSLPMFENFVFELVAAVHRGRGDRLLAAFHRYLSPAVIDHLSGRGVASYVPVIGAVRVQDYSVISEGRDQLSVEVESTLTTGDDSSNVLEMWKFVRANGVLTPEPSASPRTSPCSHCGAVTDTNRPTCAHCAKPITSPFNWEVDRMWVISETRVRASLTGTVPEQGNTLSTVFQLSVDLRMKQLTEHDPAVTWDSVKRRVERIYTELNTAWNANDLRPVRGLVTASLRNYLQYWLDAYAGQGLRNQITRAKLTKLDLAKVTRDLYYDAITVRIFATGYDFTLDKRNDVVGGSNNQYRPYTEYWTFLRSASRVGKVNDTTNCPNCGAPQSLSDAGECTHCNAMIESGAFDWVLSKIEQDDSYGG